MREEREHKLLNLLDIPLRNEMPHRWLILKIPPHNMVRPNLLQEGGAQSQLSAPTSCWRLHNSSRIVFVVWLIEGMENSNKWGRDCLKEIKDKLTWCGKGGRWNRKAKFRWEQNGVRRPWSYTKWVFQQTLTCLWYLSALPSQSASQKLSEKFIFQDPFWKKKGLQKRNAWQ